MWDCSFIASNRIVLLASRRQSRLPISESKLDHNYKIKTIYLYMFFFLNQIYSGSWCLHSSSLLLHLLLTFSCLLTLLQADLLHVSGGHLGEQGHALQRHHLQTPCTATICTGSKDFYLR